jgi:hypothetical protein
MCKAHTYLLLLQMNCATAALRQGVRFIRSNHIGTAGGAVCVCVCVCVSVSLQKITVCKF